MFSDDLLEKILTDKEVRMCPIGTQTTIIHAVEKILEEEAKKKDATVLKSELLQ